MKLRLRIWSLGLMLLLLVGLLVVAYPLVSNPDYVKALLLEEVQHEIGRKIEVGGARLELFPRIRLELSDVVVWDVDPSREFFSARRVELHLRVFSFLKRRVIAKRLIVEGPKIELHRDQAGRWNFLSGMDLPAALPLPGDQGGHSPFSLLLLVRQITLQGGEVHIVDESRPDGIRSLGLGQMDVMMTSKAGGVPLDVTFSGKILETPGASSLSLRGKVVRASAPVRIAQADPSRTGLAFQFDGTTEAVEIDLRKIAEFFGPLPVPEGVTGAATLRSRIAVMPGVLGYDMILSELKMGVEALTVSGQASLAGLMTPQPTFSLTFSATPINLKDLVAGIPPDWLHPQLPTIVTEQAIDGLVEVITATVAGSTTPEPRVSITGEVRVSQGRAALGHERTPVENLAGTVLIEPDRLKVTSLSGSIGAVRVTTGKATVSLIQPGPWLEIEFTGETTAAEMVKTLAHYTKPSGVKKALLGLKEIAGDGQITYRLAGPLKDIENLQFLAGEFVFRDAGFRSGFGEQPVTGLRGRLHVEPHVLKFDRFAWQMGPSHLDFHGAITTGDVPSYEGVTVGIRGDADHVLRFVTAGTVKKAGVQGAVDIRAAVSGLVEAPLFKGRVELKEAGLTFPGYIEKPVGKPAALEFEASLRQGETLILKQVELALPPLHLAGRGTLRLATPFGIDAALVSGPIALAGGLPDGVTMLKGIESGTLEVSMDVRGRGTDWKAWQYSGWVALTDGVFTAKGLDHPAKGVYARLKVDRNGGEIKRLAFNLLDSDVALSGTIRNWTKTPIINLKVESSDFDIDLVIPKGARSPVRDLIEEVAATSRLTAMVTIERGRYKALDFEGLSAKVSIRDGALDLDRLTGMVDGRGKVAAHVVLNLPKNQPADGEVAFQVSDVSFAKLLQVVGDDKRLVIGDLTASGLISADGADPNGTLASVNGNVDFFIKKGRIQRGTVMPKLLGILHLGSVLQGKVDLAKDGLPVDRISGAFNIQKGLVETKSLIVDSPILKMSHAGTYDMAADQLNVVLVASPLGPYAQALKGIPLFGKLFAGERRGIDTAIFEIKGPLNDPTVEYMPLKSLTTGLAGLAQLAFDVLKNLVLLPKDLIPAGDGIDQAVEPPPPTKP